MYLQEVVVFKNKLIELEGGFRKIFVIGLSIIRDAIPVIGSESAKVKGVSVINLTQGGGRAKMEETLASRPNIELLGDSGTNDICVISCLGNEIVREGGGEVRKKTKCNNVWLVPRPTTTDDEGTDALVKNTEGVLDHILGAFKGNIKVLGPSPRHLRPCCDHLVREENGHRVDKVTYCQRLRHVPWKKNWSKRREGWIYSLGKYLYISRGGVGGWERPGSPDT